MLPNTQSIMMEQGSFGGSHGRPNEWWNIYPALPVDHSKIHHGKDADNALAIWDVLEEFNEDDIPFFEIGDSSSFLMMKRNTKYPDGVYDQQGYLVEASFERFIWRLYHESPKFYLYIDGNSPHAANDN